MGRTRATAMNLLSPELNTLAGPLRQFFFLGNDVGNMTDAVKEISMSRGEISQKIESETAGSDTYEQTR